MEYQVNLYKDNKLYINNIDTCIHRYSFSKPKLGNCYCFSYTNVYVKNLSRLDGPAEQYIDINTKEIRNFFWINGSYYDEYFFTEKTNHLLCQSCNNFCKQGCFI